ncbi:hypothetical protein SLEP1_g56165 [Rubroshorea leprosula]|uniref:Uncharacterized protein n=1 Tax=Rubroshorea leprosula TaxID=152421 RepID=A0AAV5MI02_9ROSI|nr:hypothetical protein SLEP1_g56165 [Rubroshorea leprosula]
MLPPPMTFRCLSISGFGDPRLCSVDLDKGSLVFSVSCSVRCRFGGFLSPSTDLWRRARGIRSPLLLVPRDCCRLIGLPPSILKPGAISSRVDRRVSRMDRSTEGRGIS